MERNMAAHMIWTDCEMYSNRKTNATSGWLLRALHFNNDREGELWGVSYDSKIWVILCRYYRSV